MKRYFGNYKRKVGKTQSEAVEEYMKMGKTIDEMQELLECPRASIRGRISEIKNNPMNTLENVEHG